MLNFLKGEVMELLRIIGLLAVFVNGLGTVVLAEDKDSLSSNDNLASLKVTYDEYKKILKQIKKELKYEGLIRVVPIAKEKLEQTIKNRSEYFDELAPYILPALKVIHLEKDESLTAEKRKKLIKKAKADVINLKSFEQHKKLASHILEELAVEEKLKHPEAYDNIKVENLEKLKKIRPPVPQERFKSSSSEN